MRPPTFLPAALLPLPVLLGSLACAASPATPNANPNEASTAGARTAQDDDAAPSPVVPEDFAPIRMGDKDGHEYEVPFFPGATHDPAVTTPDAWLGQPVGSRLATPEEIAGLYRRWAEESDRITVHPYGRTHEGRELLFAVITSPANHARLEDLRAAHRSLWDPRDLSEAAGARLVDELPAIAWMGYSIHGDETSGADAALAVGHHLVAGTDAGVPELLEDVVVVLDPCMNPDGRGRIVTQVQQSAGQRATLDPQAMQRGRWPFGRGNHYLFDMNRDWMAGVAPETRGRWKVLLAFPPQLFVDAHEMSGLDTFLMYPQSHPRHPALPERLLHWQGVLADEHGGAFDQEGWGYYTREWADAWGPYYSDAWGSLNGAIGMLYEQGRNEGQALRRESGEVVPYREAVHGQVVASLSNLESLARHRRDVLGDYLAFRRSHVDGSRDGADRAYVFEDPQHRLVPVLVAQGVEVHRAEAAFTGREVLDRGLGREDAREFPAGTFVVPARQPQGALVRAYLDLDPRIDPETLLEERTRLERGEGTNLYDVTAWDLGRQLGLDCAWCTPGDVDLSAPLTADDPAARPVPGRAEKAFEGPAYAWAIHPEGDGALRCVARLLEEGFQVHLAWEPFVGRAGDAAHPLPRGSFLLRRHENPEGLDAAVARWAPATGAHAVALTTGRAPDLEHPDLGGGEFELLARARVALVSGDETSTSGFGHVWQYLDEVLGLPVTLLDSSQLGGTDLRPYDVLVLPPGMRAGDLGGVAEALGAWVRSGGTLVALDSAAEAAIEVLDLSAVRRRDALEDLDRYARAVARVRAARDVRIDPAEVWGDPAPDGAAGDEGSEAQDGQDASGADPSGKPDDAHAEDDTPAEERDAWQRRFMPAGAVARMHLDTEHWLASGLPAELAVPVGGSTVLLSTGDVPGRLAPADELRLGGLIWPEARERLGDSAWVLREGLGHGQVILFPHSPVFRGSWRGPARLLGNAVVIGPGAGASPTPRR